ncbi:TMEM175 family protein [soil metagenome]
MINRYPTDRVNSFSDAIFSIALTLLVLEVRVPSSADLETYGTLGVLQRLIPSFIGLLISFFVTAAYWRSHLAFAQYITEYDSRLLRLTIWLLLFVVLLPFSTAFYTKNFSKDGPYIFYCLNLVFIGFFNYLIIRRIIRTDKERELMTANLAQWFAFRSLVAPIVWLLAIPVLLIDPFLSRMTFILIFIVIALGDRKFKRRSLKAELEENKEP